jgi:hypothetical protein
MVALDPTRFDTLAKSLSTSGTRRGVGRLLAALPLAAGLASWFTPAAVQGSDSGAIVGVVGAGAAGGKPVNVTIPAMTS